MDAADRHRRLRELFHAALELQPEARSAYLHGACGGDDGLLAEVQALMAEADEPLPVPAPSWDRVIAKVRELDPAPPPRLPERIGEYRILRLIGRGGMGEVYEAEQQNPHRRVALKVIRRGADDPRVLHRFEREGEVLGGLNHPGIAKIFVAGRAEIVIPGAAPATCPYLAMELVTGDTLRKWLDRRRPALRERVELLARLADAVQYAHAQGIVHRDLKPENVVVEEISGGTILPKVLDFGVARALGPGVATTFQTQDGQILGTLAYMSPEQASGANERVDARSDVYALGVMLFECLSGRLPFDLEGKDIVESARILRDDEPARLSESDPALRGDLEVIVAKALEKEPVRRYASALAFAEDLRHFLRDEPIVARPASAIYQLRKFVRRHRAATFALVGIFTAMSVGLLVSLRLYFQEQDARSQSQAINEFLLEDMIQAAEPARGGHDRKLVDVILRATGRIDERFRGHPETEAVVRRRLSAVFRQLGRVPEAVEQADRATRLAREHLGSDHPETLEAEHALLRAWGDEGRWVSVGELAVEHAARTAERFGARHPLTWRAQLRLADSLQVDANYDRAESLLRQLAANWRTVEGHDADLEETLNILGTCLVARVMRSERLPPGVAPKLRDVGDAESVLREGFERTLARLGDSHPDTLVAMNDYGVVLCRVGKHEEAEKVLGKALALNDQVMPPGFWRRALVLGNLGRVYAASSRPTEAARTLGEAARSLSAALLPTHFLAQQCRRDQVLALCDAGMVDGAVQIREEIAENTPYPPSYWLDPLDAAIAALRKAQSAAGK